MAVSDEPADLADLADCADPADLVRAAVERGVVPGAVLLTGRGPDGPMCAAVYGSTIDGPAGQPITVDTVFDLASLTKVVATTPAVLRLTEAGELSLDDPVYRYLPGFIGPGKNAVTVRRLLAHCSGLPPRWNFQQFAGAPADRLAAMLAEPLDHQPGTVVRYSDLGFILLGEIVAAVAGQSLEAAVRELVLDPLGLGATRYLPPADWLAQIAATEAPPGGEPTCGVVHDANAKSLGGVAGHAGLFGTAPDLARYLQLCWLSEDSPLPPRLRAEALRLQTAGLDGVRGLGWMLSGDAWDHILSPPWPGTGAGLTGFTGTSLAFDVVSGVWVVLLTNAVQYGRQGRAVQLRRLVHAAVARNAKQSHRASQTFDEVEPHISMADAKAPFSSINCV